MTSGRHYRDELQDLLDGRLPVEVAPDVESHLAACLSCARELEILRRMKGKLRALAFEDLPEGVARRVHDALGAEAARPIESLKHRRLFAWIAAAAALLLAGIGTALWRSSTSTGADLVSEVAADFTDYRASRVSLARETGDSTVLERWFAGEGLPFPARVFDLGMMGYRLEGGLRLRLGNRESALFVYRSGDGTVLLCEMFEGRLEELPPPVEFRQNQGIDFAIYRRGPLTLVFWQEGPVVCALVSDTPTEDVLALAIAKAMRI